MQCLEPNIYADRVTEALIKKIDAASFQILNFSSKGLISATLEGIFGELALCVEGGQLILKRSPGSQGHSLQFGNSSAWLPQHHCDRVAKAIVQRFLEAPEHKSFNSPLAEMSATQIVRILDHPEMSKLTGWAFSYFNGAQKLQRNIILEDGTEVEVALIRGVGPAVFEFIPFRYELTVARASKSLSDFGATLLTRKNDEDIVSAFHQAFGHYNDNLERLKLPMQAEEQHFLEQVQASHSGEVLLAGRMVDETLYAFVLPRHGEKCVMVCGDGSECQVLVNEFSVGASFHAKTSRGFFQVYNEYPEGRWKAPQRVHKQDSLHMRVFFWKEKG